MYIDPVNPIIKKTLIEFLQKELNYGEQAFDYHNVIYQVQGVPDESRVLFAFKCNCAPQIFANGAQEMLD